MTDSEEHGTNTFTGVAVGVFAVLGSLAIIVTGLILGASFFIPLSISLLLFVLLTATIEWIASRKLLGHSCPRWLAHVLGVGAVILGLIVILMVLGRQAALVDAAIPLYQERFVGILERFVAVFGQDNAKMVKEQLSGIDLSGIVVAAVDEAGGFLGGLALVILYIAFMLAERRPMARKLPIAIADQNIHTHVLRIIKEIVSAVQLYVGVKTLCSTLTGTAYYIVLRLVGLDFAETWGLLAFALNFIPMIGPTLATLIPTIVSLVQFDSIGPALIVALVCGFVQFLVGNILEPAIIGRRLNLAPIMVILSLTIWGALWGIAGAFLSVPITVCLLIVFEHIPATRGVATLMSEDGLLPSMENFQDDVDKEIGR